MLFLPNTRDFAFRYGSEIGIRLQTCNNLPQSGVSVLVQNPRLYFPNATLNPLSQSLNFGINFNIRRDNDFYFSFVFS